MTRKPPRPKHVPHECESCGQTTTYAMALDHGTALIVLAVFNAVRRLDRNRVHIDKEMVALKHDWPTYQEMIEAGCMTSSMQHNVPRARYHGLIAFADRAASLRRAQRFPRFTTRRTYRYKTTDEITR